MRGLKFESDADIGGKDSFRSGTIEQMVIKSIEKSIIIKKSFWLKSIDI